MAACRALLHSPHSGGSRTALDLYAHITLQKPVAQIQASLHMCTKFYSLYLGEDHVFKDVD